MQVRDGLIDFLRDDTGAVAVDWVVLTAGIVAMGLGVMSVVRTSVVGLTDEIAHILGFHIHPDERGYQP